MLTNNYNEQTGALEAQSTTVGEVTKTLTSVANKLVDSAAGTFTATYDLEGKMLSESYPNGMSATYGHDSTGQASSIEYVKSAHCATKCPETWFSDSTLASVHGETLAQTSTLAKDNYAYDHAGRLTEAEEEPTGKACVSRLYGYDEEANRTSLTTREGSPGKCATEGGTSEHHIYDAANRLIDTGVSYETFGNTTKLPAADAGAYEIASTYYVDNQLQSQTQNSKTTTYAYDPAGRTRETISAGKAAISHYAAAGEALTWTSEGSGAWTRNIPGIDGTLCATETSAGSTTLQLHDLQGNIVATAADSETETKLLSTYNSTEFGVPQPGTTPPKYAWLGASGLATEASSPGTASKGGASYVPLIGRSLQSGPIASPGAFPDGTAAAGVVQAAYAPALDGLFKAIAVEHQAAEEAANRRQAEEEAARDECPASECGPWEGGNFPSPTEGGAEEGYYAQAQALAEEQEASDERGTNATSASFKLRLSVGCLEAGFWTYCSGQYHGKWYYNKVASNSPYKKSGLSTGVRVGAGVTGAIMVVAGGGGALACGLALTATAEDAQVELVPGELHCMAVGAGALLTGGYAVYESIFG